MYDEGCRHNCRNIAIQLWKDHFIIFSYHEHLRKNPFGCKISQCVFHEQCTCRRRNITIHTNLNFMTKFFFSFCNHNILFRRVVYIINLIFIFTLIICQGIWNTKIHTFSVVNIYNGTWSQNQIYTCKLALEVTMKKRYNDKPEPTCVSKINMIPILMHQMRISTT
jgi:hypothetical protein